MPHKCWKLGDNISTDEIISTQYLTLTDMKELGSHSLEEIKPDFAIEVSKGDILLAGENMGYGSSREHAPLALKGCGIGVIIACSFARLFYRNCINIGIPALVSPDVVHESEEGDLISVDLEHGFIRNESSGKNYSFAPFPDFINNYIMKGGLINALNDERKK